MKTKPKRKKYSEIWHAVKGSRFWSIQILKEDAEESLADAKHNNPNHRHKIVNVRVTEI